jgi:hypothetical protein
MVLVGTANLQAQGNGNGRTGSTSTYEDDGGTSVRGQLTTLQWRLDQALATIARLQSALDAEVRARQLADRTLQNTISGISGGGVTQAVLDAAIAAEATARATGDAALQGQIGNEGAARTAADTALQGHIDTLAPLLKLAPLASVVSVHTGTIDDLVGPHVIFSGANVHIRSGAGDSLVANGKGNLIVGYNESSGAVPAERSGSHNVVVGAAHRYNFGTGLVVGYANRLGDTGASITAGAFNDAAGYFSSITAGRSNSATGWFAAVTGGEANTASGSSAAVSGGVSSRAAGDFSTISGGSNNAANGAGSSVGGGANATNEVAFTFTSKP